MGAIILTDKSERGILERELRRNRDTLSIVGLGVMIMALWGVIKSFILLFSEIQKLSIQTAEQFGVAGEVMVTFFGMIAILIVLLIPTSVSIYIGLNALLESRGRVKKIHGYLYIVFTIGLAIIRMVSIILSMMSFWTVEDHLMAWAITFIIDITSFVLLVEMLYSIIKVRRIANEINQLHLTGK